MLFGWGLMIIGDMQYPTWVFEISHQRINENLRLCKPQHAVKKFRESSRNTRSK